MNDNEKIDLFDDFLDQNLSGEQLESFKAQLKNNKTLAEELAIHEDMLVGIQQQGRTLKKEHFRKLEEVIRLEELKKNEISLKGKMIRLSKLVRIGIAASIFIVVSVYLYFELTKNERLYAEYYKPYDNIVYPLIRGNEIISDPEKQAFKAYDNKQYALAAERFDKLLQHEGDETKSFYKANALLANGSIEAAIPIFKDLLTRCKEFCVQERWYLALAYLRKGDTVNAIQEFEKLINTQEPYSGNSRHILLKLE